MSIDTTLAPGSRGVALVVDDDEDVQIFVVMALERLGFAVKTAGDGMEALEMCQNEVFDLVMCDMRMPRLSGISFLKNVRIRAPLSAKRVVFLTSVDDTSVKRESIAAGAQDYLVKPITTARLAAVVNKVFGT